MIPKAAITAWRKTAPWGEDWQVEQDLILSRALVDMFSRQTVAEQAVGIYRGWLDGNPVPVAARPRTAAGGVVPQQRNSPSPASS